MGRYERTSAGRFNNIGAISITWVEADWFWYAPTPAEPFSFTRNSGGTITPGEFFFDGGSTPRITRIFAKFSPWYYAPVALIHDWLMEEKVLGRSSLAFEESVAIQQEALKTMMCLEPLYKSRLVFNLTRLALRTRRSRELWATPVRCRAPVSIACKKARLSGNPRSAACGYE